MEYIIRTYLPQKQLQSNWCWAAIASGVSRSYNVNSFWSQEAIVSRSLQRDCMSYNTDYYDSYSPCNSPYDLSLALQITNNYSAITQPISINEIIGELDNSRPVCCYIEWYGLNISHYISIIGYSENSLIITDPEMDDMLRVDFQEFQNLSNYRQGGAWTRTILTQP